MFQPRRSALCAHAMIMHFDRPAERVIERNYRQWRIREVGAASIPGSHGAHCLICESDDIVRRIWNYPSNWRSLSDDQLLNLCDRSVA